MENLKDAVCGVLEEAGVDIKRDVKLIFEEKSSDGRPMLRLPCDGRELGQFAAELGELLGAKEIFRREHTVLVVNHETRALDEIKPEAFRTWVEKHVACFKVVKMKVGKAVELQQILRTMPLDVAIGVLHAGQFFGKLRQVDRVNQVRLPFLNAAGALALLPDGYDESTRTWTFNAGFNYDEGMTVDVAVGTIMDTIKEFPFNTAVIDGRDSGMPDPRGQAVVFLMMLNFFAQGLLPRNALRPAFIVTANSQGTGKSLLIKLAIIPVAGSCALASLTGPEELRKVLDASTLAGKPYIAFDNIVGRIGGAELEAFLTSSTWEGRVMGTQKMFTANQTCSVYISGNGARVTPDMARRSLWVELFTNESDPLSRKVKNVMDDASLSEPEFRAKILSSMWAIVRHWDTSGRPRGGRVIPSFESWSRIFGGIVEAIGFNDPLKPAELTIGGDEDFADMRLMLNELHEDMIKEESREIELEFFELVELCRTKNLFKDHIQFTERKGKDGEVIEDIHPKSKSWLGKYFTKQMGKVYRVGEDGTSRVSFGVKGQHRSRRYLIRRIEE